ncbi:Dna-binding enhancer protein-like protein, partial [Thalictrum thalictroides]
MEGADEGIERLVDSKDLQQQSKALDKLTDHVEDRQLNSTRVQEAMASIYASSEADLNAMRL